MTSDLSPHLPVFWAHSSDLSLWHTNSCVGGSEQSVGYYLPWLIDNRLQKNTNHEFWEKHTTQWHWRPRTFCRGSARLHKQHTGTITVNSGNVCMSDIFQQRHKKNIYTPKFAIRVNVFKCLLEKSSNFANCSCLLFNLKYSFFF